jgi:hypothetical protein
VLDNNIFKQGQSDGKFLDNTSRKEELQSWMDYYKDNQLDLLKEEIERVYKNPNNKELLKSRANCLRLTRSIMDKISILFQSGTEVDIPDNPEATQKLNDALKSYGFFELLSTLNVYTNLQHDQHLFPRYNKAEKKTVIDIITPDITYVWQDEKFPTQINKIAYIIGEKADTLGSHQVNRVSVWTAEKNFTADIMSNGELKNIRDEVPNSYNRLPFVHFIDSHRCNEYFSSAGQPVIARNLSLNISWTEWLCSLSYQSLSTLVVSGLKEGTDIQMGMLNHILLPNNDGYGNNISNSASYINPNVNFESIFKVIADAQAMTALEYNISSDVFRGSSQANSGYQVKLNKQDIINQNMEDKPLYETRLTETVKLVMETDNLYSGNVNMWSQDLIDNVQVKINDPVFEESALDKLTINTMKLANGTTSAIDILMKDEDLSHDEAVKRFHELEKDRNIKGSAMIEPTVLPNVVETEDEDVTT